ncbi:hypothetical protein OG488_00500 [Streptomyces sp. NBC_01460]|nr:hypothetical protein [Streptomyces sp. NBC_01460]
MQPSWYVALEALDSPTARPSSRTLGATPYGGWRPPYLRDQVR